MKTNKQKLYFLPGKFSYGHNYEYMVVILDVLVPILTTSIKHFLKSTQSSKMSFLINCQITTILLMISIGNHSPVLPGAFWEV